jgi:group I intron endonuclease
VIVYWVHLKEHTDIASQGYVGVALNFKERMYRHLKVTVKLDCHFANAINKYGWDNMVKDIVFTGTEEECYLKEKELRPQFEVGWNEAIGGQGGDRSKFINYRKRKHHGWTYNKEGIGNPFYGKKHSENSLKKMSAGKCKNIVNTPDGVFNGFSEVARFYNINKITAKKWASKKAGWSYESK